MAYVEFICNWVFLWLARSVYTDVIFFGTGRR